MSPHVARILVASDVHGRIPSLFRVAAAYEVTHGHPLDAILVSGDLGVWPHDEGLDASTAKRARTSPEELGFRAFEPPDGVRFSARPEHAAQLRKDRERLAWARQRSRAPLFFVGGNHEDYRYLRAREGTSGTRAVPVDRDGWLRWIPHGSVVEIPTRVGAVRVAGLGGIAAEESGRNPDRLDRSALVDDDAALTLMDPALGPYAILVTHDAPRDLLRPGEGSSTVAALVVERAPALHLFGHYHRCVAPRRYPPDRGDAGTLSVHVNTFTPDPRTRRLRPNALGIIELDPLGVPSFAFVESATVIGNA